jgi:hypothetical protein
MTAAEQQPSMIACPYCRGENPATATQCWLCHASLAPGPEAPLPAEPGSAPGEKRPGILLSMVLILVILGCIGLLFAAFGWGILLLLALAPVLVRIWMPSSGGQTDFGRSLSAFLVVVWAGLAALVAFCVTCTGVVMGLVISGIGDLWPIAAGAILGIAVAGVVGFWIIRRRWPSRR